VDIDVGDTSAPNVVDWSGNAGLKDIIAGAWGGSWTTPDDIHYYERNDTDGTLSDGGKIEEDGEILYIGDTTSFPAPFAVKWNNDDHYDLLVGDHDGFIRYYPNNGYSSHNVTDLTHQLNVELISQEEHGDMIPPGPPTNLDAELSGTDLENITLTWTLSTDDGNGTEDVKNYAIYRNGSYNKEGVGYIFLAEVTNGTSYYIDVNSGDGNSNNYFYYVQANDTSNNNNWTGQTGKNAKECVEGWNFISDPYLGLDGTNITEVLRTLEWNMARWYNATDAADHWKSYTAFKPSGFNDFLTMNRTMGIWVNVTIGGDHFVDAGRVYKSTAIQLYEGWNLVSYSSFINRTVEDALSDIWSCVDKVEAFDKNDAPYYLKKLSSNDWMEASCAYWIRVSEDCTWSVKN